MKLSLPMIAEKLNFAVLSELPKGASKELRLNRPVFYTDEKVLKADTLYICKGLSLPAKISAEDGCALICIGFPEKTASNRAINDILILDKDVDIFKLGNAVNKIFDFYDNLEEEQKLLSGELNPTAVLAGLLKKSIETGSLDRRSLDSELKQVLGWSNTGDFKVLLARASSQTKSSLGAFCKSLINEYPGIIAFVYQQSIVIVTNLFRKFQEENYQKLLQFLQENNYRIGISNGFSSIYDTGMFYRQARIALDFGVTQEAEKLDAAPQQPEDSGERLPETPEEAQIPEIFYFSDFALSYILDKATEEFDQHELSSPIYLRLEKYDREYNTDYLKTLKVYLFNNQNAVQTAKDLYIHRATIIYRIKRICEIGQTDLADPQELLHLYLTFQLLER
ncbi:MAG: helix-turn-helix domain-containing protein [Lachnospiraceae bacterium]|nr:helix-turn-helix domain-containing protein [Lachnospiraceae bacterium]